MAILTNDNTSGREDAISFGTVAAGQTIVVSHASVVLVDDTNPSVLLWTGRLAANRTLVENDPINVPMGDLDIVIPAGSDGINDSALVAVLNEGIGEYSDNFTVRLGTADMGNAGTSNQPAGSTGYTAATNQVLTFKEGVS